MITVVRLVAQVLLGVALLEIALGALSPLIVLQLEQRDVAAEIIGLVGSAYFVGFLAGTLTCHHVIDRVGHARAFSVFTVIAVNAVILHIVLDQPTAWLALRVFVGYGVAGVFVIVESWLNDKATVETRGRILALYTMVAWGASSLGPLGLNIRDPRGITQFCLIAVVMATAIIPLALTRVGNPEIGHRSQFGIRRLYAISPLGALACFASGVINTALFFLLPIFGRELNYSDRDISIVLSASYIAPLFLQYPIGWLADRFGRRPMMLATTLVAIGLSTAIVNLAGQSFLWFALLCFLLASMVAPLYALGVGQTADYVDRKNFVAASAGLLFTWGIGASIGPVAAAPAMRWFGAEGLFYFITACHLLLASFILYRIIARRALSPKQQGNYVAVPVTQGTYGAPELDPRGDEEPDPKAASRAIASAVD